MLERISWPVNVTGYEFNKGKVLVLSDEHYSLDDTCKSCHKPKCMDIITLIDELAKSEDNLNVFLEIRGNKKVEENAGHIAIVGNKYLKKIFEHSRKSTNAKFHFIDIRNNPEFAILGFDINFIADILLAIGKDYINNFSKYYLLYLKELYPTKSSFIKTCNAIMFSKDLRKHVPSSKLIPKMSKIAKQIYKLPVKYQKIVIEFSKKQINRVINTNDNAMVKLLLVCSIFMDTYAISRFLYYHEEGSTSVIYAGYLHTAVYQDFLMTIGAKKIIESYPIKKRCQRLIT